MFTYHFLKISKQAALYITENYKIGKNKKQNKSLLMEWKTDGSAVKKLI